MLTEDGLFFHPHPGEFDSSTVPTTGYLPSKAQKMLMPGNQPELVHVIRWLRGKVLHEFQPSLSYRMNVVWPNQFQPNSRYLCISQFQLRPAPPGWPLGISIFCALDGKFPGVGTLELLSCQIPQHFSLIAQEESGWKEILELPGRQGGRLERLGRKMNTIQVSVRTCKWC